MTSMSPQTRPLIRGTQHCPTCGLPADRDHRRTTRGVNLATFCCPTGHIWSIHWVAV